MTERAIVIRRSDYGESNCMLSLFTERHGVIPAVIYGVKRGKNNTKAASGQFLCYGDYDLYEGRGAAASVNHADIRDAFLPVSESIPKLALCSYMAEVVMTLLGENNPDERLFGIFLNCVYALAYRDDDIAKVKSVFEMKAMCAEGLSPVMSRCVKCGSEDIYAFDAREGGMVCRGCMRGTSRRISTGAYRAISYLTVCPDKKMLSFSTDDESAKETEEMTEVYLLEQTDRGYRSLDYFKAVKDI